MNALVSKKISLHSDIMTFKKGHLIALKGFLNEYLGYSYVHTFTHNILDVKPFSQVKASILLFHSRNCIQCYLQPSFTTHRSYNYLVLDDFGNLIESDLSKLHYFYN